MDVSSKDFQRKPGEYIDAAVSGESVVIIRHSRPAAVIIQHEQWRQMTFDDPRWRSVLNRMAGKWPTQKSDHELITDLLQRWEIDQAAGNNKSDLLYSLLWLASAIARAVGVTGLTVDAVKHGGSELKKLWKAEVQP
jgi:prevent-host-death family protein